MTQQQPETRNDTVNLDELAEPVQRIATKLADVSADLVRLSELLQGHRIDRELVRRPDPDQRESADQSPPARGLTMGEPVDTSFATPTQTPAATAAGASPFRSRISSFGLPGVAVPPVRGHAVVWAATSIALFGVLVLLIVFSWL